MLQTPQPKHMSQRQSKRYRITQTLLSGWLWSYKIDDGYEDFLKTLNREPKQQTKAMLDGIRFENVLNATLNGAEIDPTHEWYEPIKKLLPSLQGASQQVVLYKDMTVNGVDFLLHGVLDYLRAGVIYDTKFSKTYEVGKYLDSVQHPMYFALTPEAYEFQYLICDGTWVYTETYRPDDVEPIERTIKQFMEFLDKRDLVKIYCEKWQAKF